MKRIISLIFAILFCFSVMTGCDIEAGAGSRYDVDIDRVCGGWTYDVYVDTETKVMYLKMGGSDSCGICPLYNADGSLRLYQGE